MTHRSGVARFRTAVALPALALVATGLATGASGVTAAAADSSEKSSVSAEGASDHYINYVAPQVEKAFSKDVKAEKGQNADAIAKAMAFDAKHARGNPVTARELAKLEAKAIRTGRSPKEIKGQYKGAKATQEAKRLTILVEFNENANDDFSGTMVPESF
ncbi:MAG: hypothetical protein ACM3XQ_05185, partial [Nocardioidaceae bacterium]